MKIIVRNGITLSILRDDLDYPFIGYLKPDMLCENLSAYYNDPNTREILLVKEWGISIMSMEDIEKELLYYNSNKSIWRSEKRRKILFDYFTKVHWIMKQYKREDSINKVLNSNECQLYLAC